jgi:hypothetical protein
MAQRKKKMSSNSLYKLSSEYQQLMAKLFDPATGEIDPVVDAEITALAPTVESKAIAVASYIRSMEDEKRNIEILREELMERQAAYDNRIASQQKYLQTCMEMASVTEVTCPYFTIRLKKNQHSTDITSESAIPAEFFNERTVTKTERKPDRNRIKEHVLKTGYQIPGATVLQKTKLEITTDRI